MGGGTWKLLHSSASCLLLLMQCPLWTGDGLSWGDRGRLQSPWPTRITGRSHSAVAPVGPEGVSNCISQALNKTRPCSSWSWSSCWDVAVICDSSAGCGSSACQKNSFSFLLLTARTGVPIGGWIREWQRHLLLPSEAVRSVGLEADMWAQVEILIQTYTRDSKSYAGHQISSNRRRLGGFLFIIYKLQIKANVLYTGSSWARCYCCALLSWLYGDLISNTNIDLIYEYYKRRAFWLNYVYYVFVNLKLPDPGYSVFAWKRWDVWHLWMWFFLNYTSRIHSPL